jgi:cytochrome P450
MVGLDLAEWEYFATAAHAMSYLPTNSPAFPHAEIARIQQRLVDLCAARRARPADDIVSALLRGEVGGRYLTDAEAALVLAPLVFGGFDTTASLILHALNWLSEDEHGVYRRRLVEDRALMNNAIEEFLRYFTPIHGVARNLTCDVELRGQHLKGGERVYLNWAAANRDPEIFETPHEVRLERRNARKHASFSFGLHRCLGANLARIEIRAALTAVLTRMPDYRIVREQARRYPALGLVNGWITLPATFTPDRWSKQEGS